MTTSLSQPDVLDPHRPWITDERQLPSRMRWLDALFNPAGTSPKLHFTRVWTLCFFLQAGIVVVPVMLGLLMSLAGGDGSPITKFGAYASPIIFVVTTLISFINHVRRLNDAGKTSLLAIIVVIPLIIGLALTVKGVSDKQAAYDKLYAERTEYLADPDAWRAKRQAARNEAEQKRQEAAASGEAGDTPPAAQQQRGQRPGRGPSADRELPSQAKFVIEPNLGTIQMVSIPLNMLIMIWSLLWVARVPFFGSDVSDAAKAYD